MEINTTGIGNYKFQVKVLEIEHIGITLWINVETLKKMNYQNITKRLQVKEWKKEMTVLQK